MRRLILPLIFAVALSSRAEVISWLGGRYSVALSFTTTQPDRIPLPQKIASPEYPADMIFGEIGGEVIIEFSVSAKGRVSSIRIVKSGGEDFEHSVEATAKAWRFSPAVDPTTGKPVAVVMRCSVVFSTEEKRPNQPPEPTALSVTPRADARVAPASTVAHL
jgi:TonB family protein